METWNMSSSEPPWKREVKVPVSKLVLSVHNRKAKWHIIIFWSMIRCCTCHCFGDVGYTNSKQMSSIIQVLAVWLYVLIPCSYFMLILQSGTLSVTKERLWVVLLCFKCQVLCSGSLPKMWSRTSCSDRKWLWTISILKPWIRSLKRVVIGAICVLSVLQRGQPIRQSLCECRSTRTSHRPTQFVPTLTSPWEQPIAIA